MLVCSPLFQLRIKVIIPNSKSTSSDLIIFTLCQNFFWLAVLNVAILSLYVFKSADDGFQHIFILMMSDLLTYSIAALINGIGGGLICDCTSALSQAGIE